MAGWEGSEMAGQRKPGEPLSLVALFPEPRAGRCARAGVCLQGAACWPAAWQPSRSRPEHGAALPAVCGQRAGDDFEIPGERARPIVKASFLAGRFIRWPREITSLSRVMLG